MKYFSAIVSTIAVIAAANAASVSVSYDQTYDDAGTPLDNVACSNGPNGLERFGYHNVGDLPDFPYIGGASVIAGYGSSNCGSCWKLTYKGKSINVLAIDHTDNGFNIALSAMNDLTNGQAEFLGRVQATATQVSPSVCGLPSN